MELEQDGAARGEVVAGGGEQAAVVAEPALVRDDGVARLVRIALGGLRRQVGEIGDDEVEAGRDAFEQVSLEQVHPRGEPVRLEVRAGERDGRLVRVGGPHLGLRQRERERDRDRAGPGADVGDPRGRPGRCGRAPPRRAARSPGAA